MQFAVTRGNPNCSTSLFTLLTSLLYSGNCENFNVKVKVQRTIDFIHTNEESSRVVQ